MAVRHRAARRLLAGALAAALAFGTVPLGPAFGADEGESADAAASSDEASASSSASSSSTRGFGFSGSYSGEVVADAEEVTSESPDVQVSQADRVAALAQNGGALSLIGGRVVKRGDGTDDADCRSYGVNSVVLAVGETSRAVVSGTVLQGRAKGADGLFATDGATVYANGVPASTTAGSACGAVATYGGTVVGNDLELQTRGDGSPALAAGPGGGSASIANSTVTTAGREAPLLQSAGQVEADNVSGTARSSQIARIQGTGAVVLAHCTFSSAATDAVGDDPVACGIAVYREATASSASSGTAGDSTGSASSAAATGTAGGAEAPSADGVALFQAQDSVLSSDVSSGAFFYFTNTQADVVLSGTELYFDSSAAALMQVVGNDAGAWGTAGRNGAAVTFTGIDEKLAGDVSVDTASSLDFYLLEGTTWKGACSIATNTAAGGSAASGDTEGGALTVNIDATSGWTVTGDSTVANLNIANGGKLVDSSGKAVKIVDADGNTLVDGASSVKVAVANSFTTTVKAGNANKLQGAQVSRDDFDAVFGTSTAFGTNGLADEQTDEDRALATAAYVRKLFYDLFGLPHE